MTIAKLTNHNQSYTKCDTKSNTKQIVVNLSLTEFQKEFILRVLDEKFHLSFCSAWLYEFQVKSFNFMCLWLNVYVSTDRFYGRACVNKSAGRQTWAALLNQEVSILLKITLAVCMMKKQTVAMLLWYQIIEMSETTSSEAIPQFCKRFSRWFDSFFWCGSRWRWTLGFLTPPWPSAFLKMSRGEVWILSRIDTYLNWMRIEEVSTEILHHHNRNTNTPLYLLLFTSGCLHSVQTAWQLLGKVKQSCWR